MGSSSSIKPQLFHGDCTLSRPMCPVVIRNCDLRAPLHSLVGPAGLYYDIYSYLLRLDLVRLPGTVLATGVTGSHQGCVPACSTNCRFGRNVRAVSGVKRLL